MSQGEERVGSQGEERVGSQVRRGLGARVRRGKGRGHGERDATNRGAAGLENGVRSNSERGVELAPMDPGGMQGACSLESRVCCWGVSYLSHLARLAHTAILHILIK